MIKFSLSQASTVKREGIGVPSLVILKLAQKHEGDDQSVDDQGLDERQADDQGRHDLARGSRVPGDTFHSAFNGDTLPDPSTKGGDADSKTRGEGDAHAHQAAYSTSFISSREDDRCRDHEDEGGEKCNGEYFFH